MTPPEHPSATDQPTVESLLLELAAAVDERGREWKARALIAEEKLWILSQPETVGDLVRVGPVVVRITDPQALEDAYNWDSRCRGVEPDGGGASWALAELLANAIGDLPGVQFIATGDGRIL